MKVFTLFILFFSSLPVEAFSGIYKVFVERQEEKKERGWSLSDWLGTKKRISLMDEWLSLNSSSDIFELYGGGAGGSLKEEENYLGNNFPKRDLSAWHAGFSLWIFGAEYKVEDWEDGAKDEHFHGLLRILGNSAQSSHIQLFYGQRKLKNSHLGGIEQNYFGGAIHLYLVSSLGGYWKYQKFDNADLPSLAISVESKRSTLGAFLDIWGLRLYAEFFNEKFENSQGAIVSKIDGSLFGTTLHF